MELRVLLVPEPGVDQHQPVGMLTCKSGSQPTARVIRFFLG
jgi:hypothetical protein